MRISRELAGWLAMAVILIGGSVAIFFQDPIAQDISYHRFADERTLLGVPNFWNVVTNLCFLVVGLIGVAGVRRTPPAAMPQEIRSAYLFFFAGVALVGLGSGYYHIWPDNQSLVWDRLPMTIAFMALMTMIIADYLSARAGRLLLYPLLATGLFSVVHWHFSEIRGAGDLRPYILVQFLPIVTIPVIIGCFRSQSIAPKGYWLLIGWYLIAKIVEHFDAALFSTLSVISGHSLKHCAAALGIFLLYRSIVEKGEHGPPSVSPES